MVLGWVTASEVQLPVQENLSQYITSHSGQLSLVIPSWVGAVSSLLVMDTAAAKEENGAFCVTIVPVTRTAGIGAY